jgi:hypothetical protein
VSDVVGFYWIKIQKIYSARSLDPETSDLPNNSSGNLHHRRRIEQFTTMEKTAESVSQEVAALKQILAQVSAAIDNYAEIATKNVGQKSIEASGEVSDLKTVLFMETHKLMRTARGPLNMVFSHFENVRSPLNRMEPLN